MDERGDALGLFGGDGAGEDVFGQEEIFGVERKAGAWGVAFTQEDGREAKMAAQGFGDEMLAFDGDEAGGRSAGARECGTQLLNARILAAGDETGLRAEGAGGHRGDFTLPGLFAGGILSVENIFLFVVVMLANCPALRVA
jgi:hypothetical protein